MKTNKKTAVLVLGAPRSGTSLISHVISELGFYFGDPGRFVDSVKHPWNPMFFEQQSLNDLNDEIAKALGVNYLDFDWFPLKEDFGEEFVLGFEERVNRFLGNEFGMHESIALKDPRFCLTLPVWSSLLKRRGYRVRFVWAVRDLSSCFMSNKAVNNSHPQLHERLVTLSSYAAAYFLDGENYFLANYDEFIQNPDLSVSVLAKWLEVSVSRVETASGVIQAQLRHMVASKNSLPHELKAISELLLNGKLTADHYLEFRRYLSAHGFIGLLQERSNLIVDLRYAVAAKDVYISGLQGVVATKDQVLAGHEAQICSLNQTASDRDGQIVTLSEVVTERDAQIASLNQTASDRDRQIVTLSEVVAERDAQIASLNKVILAYQKSTSWRVTKPLRIIGYQIKRIKRVLSFFFMLLINLNELKRILIKVIRIYAREGISGVENRLKLLQSDQYAGQMARYRGLSNEFLRGLIFFANLLFRLKQWWFANETRRRFSDRGFGFLRGETKSSRKLSQGPLRIHVDKPHIGIINFVKNMCVVSGWAVNLDTHSAANVRIVVGKSSQHTHPKQREDVQRAFAHTCKLPLETGFASVLTLPVGVHRMRIEVEGFDGSWYPVRRALLFRMPRLSRTQRMEPRLSYSAWTRLEQKRLKAEIPDIKRHIDVMLLKPEFTVVVDMRQGAVDLEDTLRSIRQQLYPHYDIRALTGAGIDAISSFPDDVKPLTDTSLSSIRGDFIVFLQSGQRLAGNALYEFSGAINGYPDIDLVYGDQDIVTASGGRCDPFHKPGWSPDYLETFNYIGFTACFRTSIARGCFDKAHVYDLVLRFTERTTRVLHIGKILGHGVVRWGEEKAASANAVAQDIAALSGRLSRTGRRGSVREHELHKGCYEIRIDLKRSPLVSVVIPTAGKTVTVGERRIDLIENVIGQIRDKSTYKNIEIIVVDNGDLFPTQVRMLAEAGCKRITYSDPVFNIAKKLNLGVSIAKGELLLLMNDDIEILTSSWIERLLEHFEKPHVGVVGAKLLYPNEQTQHVGVVHNYGNPDHVRRLYPRYDAGYFFSTCGVRNYSAVTGACMMTLASIYRAVEGYSDELAVSYNDVDYCLKVRQKGLWVVYAPSVELTHMESQSRVAFADMSEVSWYHHRWAAKIVSDEFYNERFLTVASPTFVPHINQRML